MDEKVLPENGRETPPPGWRDIAAPLAALVLAALWFSVFGLDRLLTYNYMPGVGVTAIVFLHFAAVLLLRRHDAPPDRAGLWLMAAALTLAVCVGLYAAWLTALINCALLFCVSAAATFRLSGHSRLPWDSGRAICETASLTARALTRYLGRVFKAIGLAAGRRDGQGGGLLLGILLAVPLLALVLVLLSSADAVFGGLFAGLFDAVKRLDFSLWHILRVLLLALFLSSALFFLGQAPEARPTHERTAKAPNALPFLVAVLLLDGVYLVFIVIQIAYLFGGAESAAMAGGWAEYARSGFFQLVAVAAINLLLCLISSGGGRLSAKGGRALFRGDALLLAASAVILASAAWRMGLYIRAFGLSLLRLMTLWVMLFIAVLLVTAAVRLLRPSTRFGRVFIGFGLAAWCLFCLADPAGLVAGWNVRAYESGRLSELDSAYLEELYPDARAARDDTDADAWPVWSHPAPSLAEWHISFLFDKAQ